jgi:hypothetical protein
MNIGSSSSSLNLTLQCRNAFHKSHTYECSKRVIERTDDLLDLCSQLELSLIKRDELTKKIAGSLANEAAA